MSEETKNQTENLNLIDVMNPWIYQNGYPVVSVKRNYEIGSVTINQVWFTFDNISEKSEKLWYIPLSFTNSSDNWSSPSKILMTKKEMSVENVGIANESWIVFNIDGEGYYRVNYDNDNWKFLAEALKENPEQFPPATRASLIDDVLSLAQGGLTSYRVALDFINYMRTKERHYAPWAALTTHLLKLKFALYDTDMYSDFQKFARQFLSAIYNETESTNEGSQLAVVIKKFACTFEHPQCVDWAKKIFAEAKTSGVNSVSLHTREIFYCTVARVGGEDDWQYLLQKAINATDKEEKNRLLSSLACFQVPWILQKILKMTLEENLFSEEENRLILHSFSRNPEAAFAVQRFIERNWPEITKRYQSSYFMMKEYILAMTKSLMTKQDLVMFQEFRDNNIKSLKAVGFNVVLAEVESSSWEQWRNISLPVIETWIKESNKV